MGTICNVTSGPALSCWGSFYRHTSKQFASSKIPSEYHKQTKMTRYIYTMALTLSLTVRHGMGQDLVLMTISTKATDLLMLVVMTMTIVTTINVETLFDSTTRSVRAGEICIVFSRGLALTCSTKAGNKTILF